MKRICSIVLTLCMMLSLLAMLASCRHTCTFATDWTKDDSAHWHACTGKDCAAVADKATHTWNEGLIFKAPSATADGEKTLTCTVCGHTVVQTFPCEHIWDEGVVTKTPTTTADGEKTITCTLCGKTAVQTFQCTDHEWDAGVITQPATQEADGVKTFTCTICGETGTAKLTFKGLSKTDWQAITAEDAFENCTHTESFVAKASGIEATSTIHILFTKDKAVMTSEIPGQPTETETVSGAASVREARISIIDMLANLLKYENYTYDQESKTYKLNKEITEPLYGEKITNAVLTMENGKVASILYTFPYTESNVTMQITATFTFSDYGTTVIE